MAVALGNAARGGLIRKIHTHACYSQQLHHSSRGRETISVLIQAIDATRRARSSQL